MQIGKFIGYVILILAALFALEWFAIVDVPYFEIPNFLSGKQEAISTTSEALKDLN